uniref:THUMP domain-containing protein n=1 Tax=Rhabditophanes sp. KR3021 TaxID=114890 RepID=A0AC35UC98_9BILA
MAKDEGIKRKVKEITGILKNPSTEVGPRKTSKVEGSFPVPRCNADLYHGQSAAVPVKPAPNLFSLFTNGVAEAVEKMIECIIIDKEVVEVRFLKINGQAFCPSKTADANEAMCIAANDDLLNLSMGTSVDFVNNLQCDKTKEGIIYLFLTKPLSKIKGLPTLKPSENAKANKCKDC